MFSFFAFTIDKEMAAELLKIFDMHDRHYVRALGKRDVANVIRTCGYPLSDKDIEGLFSGSPDPVPRESFRETVQKLVANAKPLKEAELITALRAFDTKELGTVSRADLSTILTTMNLKLTSTQLEDLLEDVLFQQDRVGIEDLARHMLRPTKDWRVENADVHSRMSSPA
jgi:Ca2+-binding EF-hand superfamily protein